MALYSSISSGEGSQGLQVGTTPDRMVHVRSSLQSTIELVNKIMKKFVGAPSPFEEILEILRILSKKLKNVNLFLSGSYLHIQRKTEIRKVTDSCLKVLVELEQTFEKHCELKPNSGIVETKMKMVWQSLKWEPEDIKELRRRIFAEIVTLSNSVERWIVEDWVTPIDYAPQQNDFISRRQRGTGQWLLDSAEYHTWRETDKQTLFCFGIPGAGKTILTSIIVEELKTRFGNDESIGVAYLYCDFRRQDMQKAEDLFASLLKQLTQHQSSLSDSVKYLYDRHMKYKTRPSLDEFSKTLQSVAAMFSKVFIVVDGLDECQKSNGCRTRFLSDIFNLQAKFQVNFLVTSRHIPEIEEKFNKCLRLEILASNHDVKRYLDDHISKLPIVSLLNSELEYKIKEEITKAADGSFLLVQLHFELLRQEKTLRGIRVMLASLPTSYWELYEHIVFRIKIRHVDEANLAKHVLSWITFAARPLTTSELRHACAIEIGESRLDEENLCSVEEMVSVCSGLVTVDLESGVTRLANSTIQTYLEQIKEEWFLDIEAAITKFCVTYLSFDNFEGGFCQNDEEFEKRLQLNQFYGYASRNWGHHARKASKLIPEVITFLEKRNQVEASSQALLGIKSYSGYSERPPRQMTGLHLAAYFGVTEAVNELHQRGHILDLNDSHGRTPLSYAAENGHEVVVRLLLATGQVDAHWKDNDDETPLSYANRKGYSAIARLLKPQNLSDPGRTQNLDYEAGYDARSLEYEESDIESIFSTGSLLSSQSSLGDFFLIAVSELANLLLNDDGLMPLYPMAISKVGSARFQRNFARFLKLYSRNLKTEASTELQCQAAHFVRISAHRTAAEIGRLLMQNDDEFLGERKLEVQMSKTAQVTSWLNSQKDGHKQQDAGINPDADSVTMNHYELSDGSDSSESDSFEQTPLHSIDEVRDFMKSGQAFSNLRQEFRAWLKLDKRGGSKDQNQKLEDQEKVKVEEDCMISGSYIPEFQGPQRTSILRIMDAIEIFRRPKTLSGWKRITWRSAYGKPLYIDVKEALEGGAAQLQKRLRNSASLTQRTEPQSSRTSSLPGEPSIPAPAHIPNIPGTLCSLGDTNSQNHPCRQIDPATANDQFTSTVSNQRQRDRRYLLLCFSTRKSKSFRQIDMTDLTNDQYLFQRIHDVYWEIRFGESWIAHFTPPKLLTLPSWISWCFDGVHFFTPKRADFISFTLMPIRQNVHPYGIEPSLPPEDEVKKQNGTIAPVPN